MLYIGKYQSTKEFMVEDNEAIKDKEDREESAERVNWNQDQYQPEKKTTEIIFII